MNMSFWHTREQMKRGLKGCTTRAGWSKAKEEMIITAIEKGQGLPKGTRIVSIGEIQISKVEIVRLDQIDKDTVIQEGFPWLTPEEMTELLCRIMNKRHYETARRIWFEILYEPDVDPNWHNGAFLKYLDHFPAYCTGGIYATTNTA